MPTTLINSIEIQCPAEALYRYVTQPWRWHEWHPNSRSATVSARALQIGDSFDEAIELQPFSLLPFRLRRATRYRVLAADPFQSWEVRGETRDGWLRIRYELEPAADGTLFTRTLTYQVRGPTALLMPFLKSGMARQSLTALQNLKCRLESGDES